MIELSGQLRSLSQRESGWRVSRRRRGDSLGSEVSVPSGGRFLRLFAQARSSTVQSARGAPLSRLCLLPRVRFCGARSELLRGLSSPFLSLLFWRVHRFRQAGQLFLLAEATTTILFEGENLWRILAAFFILEARESEVPPNFMTSFNPSVPLDCVFSAYAYEISDDGACSSFASCSRPDEGYVSCVLGRE